MAVLSFPDQALAALRPLWPQFQLWVVYGVRPAPDIYCARRVGEELACVNAHSPEELVRALRELSTQ